MDHLSYRKCVEQMWADDQIVPEEIGALVNLQAQLGVPDDDASNIEREVMGMTKEEALVVGMGTNLQSATETPPLHSPAPTGGPIQSDGPGDEHDDSVGDAPVEPKANVKEARPQAPPASTDAASMIYAFIHSHLVELQSRPSGAFVIFVDEKTDGIVQFSGSSEDPIMVFDMPLPARLPITPDDISTAKQIVTEFGGEEREFDGYTTLNVDCGDPEQAAEIATAMLCRVFAVGGTASLSVKTEEEEESPFWSALTKFLWTKPSSLIPTSIKEAAWAPWLKWALIVCVVTWIVGSWVSYGFLAALAILIGPFVLWWGKVNACVECKKWFKRKTTSDTKTIKNTSESLAHGRVTRKGNYDQRYNTVVTVTETGIRHRTFKCTDCEHTWKLDEPYSTSQNVSPG